jgi:hypothetical protein
VTFCEVFCRNELKLVFEHRIHVACFEVEGGECTWKEAPGEAPSQWDDRAVVPQPIHTCYRCGGLSGDDYVDEPGTPLSERRDMFAEAEEGA